MTELNPIASSFIFLLNPNSVVSGDQSMLRNALEHRPPVSARSRSSSSSFSALHPSQKLAHCRLFSPHEQGQQLGRLLLGDHQLHFNGRGGGAPFALLPRRRSRLLVLLGPAQPEQKIAPGAELLLAAAPRSRHGCLGLLFLGQATEELRH